MAGKVNAGPARRRRWLANQATPASPYNDVGPKGTNGAID